MANEDAYNTSNSDNYAYQDVYGNAYGTCAFGGGVSAGSIKGAIRFPSIPIAQGTTVNFAMLYFYCSNVGSGSGNLKAKIYGIDEDNTAILTGDPFGRLKTDAFTLFDDIKPSAGTYEDLIVTNAVNEILARPGWSSGNAMGFYCEDNGSPLGVWVSDPSSGAETYLLIRVSAAPNFKPTPGSIAAPTFPNPNHYGIKISKPGVDVLTATEAQLYFTTRKKEFKVKKQENVTCQAGVEKVIAHGVGYAPSVLGYAKGSTYRFKLNRGFPGTNPIVGSPQGYIGADASNVRIIIDQNNDVYYYVFVDPLTE